MTPEKGIRLEFSDKRLALYELPEINRNIKQVGWGVWPLDLSQTAADIKQLLREPTLTTEEAERVKSSFLLPREKLLEIIQRSGREPHVPGGGELTTTVTNLGYTYPQLYMVENGVDYSRFDRIHVNTADDGTAVDEVVQLLSGSGLVIHHRSPDGLILTLRLACSGDEAGWLITYTGGNPHIGSLSGGSPGMKMLVQVIGPAKWVMRYEDEQT